MRGLVGAVLAVGLLMGCGGVEEGTAAEASRPGDGDVKAMACSDCQPLYVRCMSRAKTPEAAQSCEDSRQLCQETFCSSLAPAPGGGAVQ